MKRENKIYDTIELHQILNDRKITSEDREKTYKEKFLTSEYKYRHTIYKRPET